MKSAGPNSSRKTMTLNTAEELPAVDGEQVLPVVPEPVHHLPVLCHQQAAHCTTHPGHQTTWQKGAFSSLIAIIY